MVVARVRRSLAWASLLAIAACGDTGSRVVTLTFASSGTYTADGVTFNFGFATQDCASNCTCWSFQVGGGPNGFSATELSVSVSYEPPQPARFGFAGFDLAPGEQLTLQPPLPPCCVMGACIGPQSFEVTNASVYRPE